MEECGKYGKKWDGMGGNEKVWKRVDAIYIHTHEKNRARRVTDQLTSVGKSCQCDGILKNQHD